ncbi:hypothetical protein [Sediminibacterium sp.]|uniref:hypothetical protein n=1 Tax=Sediminibacterium sp. TaxID=1917865 RepID=UPI0027360A0E|nr:hypothetical protein [Sediminibacterium sp.]MDP3394319.1 hypothetical protein [Sediminibacterium sp.]MDP3568154.1 hypothetical protein [Sediminibacterium sp.]
MNRSVQKKVVGGEIGVQGEGGTCVGCVCGSIYSCWYTNGSAADLCARVYPNCTSYSSAGVVPCNGCNMN